MKGEELEMRGEAEGTAEGEGEAEAEGVGVGEGEGEAEGLLPSEGSSCPYRPRERISPSD